MRSKKTKELEPKNAKWLNMKIITSGGNINRLVMEIPSLSPKGINIKYIKAHGNTIRVILSATKPDLFMLMLKSARFSIANGIMFKAVFKDGYNTLDWCGYYETSISSTIEGSRFTNREKLNQMLQTYFA